MTLTLYQDVSELTRNVSYSGEIASFMNMTPETLVRHWIS